MHVLARQAHTHTHTHTHTADSTLQIEGRSYTTNDMQSHNHTRPLLELGKVNTRSGLQTRLSSALEEARPSSMVAESEKL